MLTPPANYPQCQPEQALENKKLLRLFPVLVLSFVPIEQFREELLRGRENGLARSPQILKVTRLETVSISRPYLHASNAYRNQPDYRIR
jgi:hypothetical protein